MINYNNIKKYIDSLKDENGFRFSIFSSTTILSTSFGVQTLFLLDELEYLDKNREFLLNNILDCSQSDGTFLDKNYDLDDSIRYHKNDYVIPQFTFFSLIALDMLGNTYSKLEFMNKYLDIPNLEDWFESLNWSTFWYESNKIMFMMYFLTYLLKYGNSDIKQKVQEAINFSFDLLDNKQDPLTGLWGTNLNDNNIQDGVFGAAHIYLFYNFHDRKINFQNKIANSVKSLHSANGLALSREGGACEDYDLVEVYSQIDTKINAGSSEIKKNIFAMYKEISRNQSKDGGFPYRKYSRKKIFFKAPKDKLYTYSSWEVMQTPIYYPDIWGTYFRLLAIAKIEKMLGIQTYNFKSYSLPGWGYL